jgi:hypothetical protein
MALTPQEQAKLNELQQESLEIAEKIAKVAEKRLKAEGEFLTKLDKSVISSQASLDLAQENLKAVNLQKEINENQNLSAEQKKRLQGELNSLFKAQTDALKNNVDLSAEEIAALNAQIVAQQEKIKNGETTVQIQRQQVANNKELAEQEKKKQVAANQLKGTFTGMFGDMAGLFGISTKFNGVLGGILGNMKTLGPMGTLKEMASSFADVFTFANVAGSAIQGFAEAVVDVLSTQADITRNTGLNKEFIDTFTDMRQGFQEAAPGVMLFRDEMFSMGESLSSTLPIFTSLGAESRAELMSIGVMASKVGVDVGDFSEIIVNMMEHSGASATTAAGTFKTMTEELMQFGIQPDEAAKGLAKFLPKLAHLGSRGPKVFKEMTLQAKAMNTSIEEMLNTVQGFKTFDDAIPRANKLNAIFMKLTGTSKAFFNAQELVNAATEQDQFNILQKSVAGYGMSLKELASAETPMARHALNALQEAMGTTDVAELIKQFDDVGKTLNPVTQEVATLEDRLRDTNDPTQVFKQVLEDLMADGTLQELAMALASIIREVVAFTKENPGLVKGLLATMVGVNTVGKTVETAGGLTSFFGMFKGKLKMVTDFFTKFQGLIGTFVGYVSVKFAAVKGFFAAGGGFASIFGSGGTLAVFFGKIGTFFSGIFGSGGMIATGLAAVKSFLAPAITAVTGLFTGMGAAISGIVAVVVSVFYSLYENWDLVVDYFSEKFDVFTSMFDSLPAFFSGIFEGFLMILDIPVAIINAIINGVGDLIDYLFGTNIGDTRIPLPSNAFGGFGDEAGGAVTLASGGTIGSSPTLALVGEEGPEMVVLPPRSTVMSNPDSQNVAAMAEGTASSTKAMQRTVAGMGNTPSAQDIADKIVAGLAPLLSEISNAVASNGDAKIYLDSKQVGNMVYKPVTGKFKKEMTANIFGGMRI